MSDLKFGDTVQVSSKLVRTRKRRNSDSINNVWVEVNTKARIGIFIGTRYLTNGLVTYSDGCHVYESKETLKAGLICTNSNVNPYYVPLNDIRKVRK